MVGRGSLSIVLVQALLKCGEGNVLECVSWAGASDWANFQAWN